MIRKICVFTGTRAEYGLLSPLMGAVKKEKKLDLQIVASGMHLSEEFGLTYKDIEKDGFRIDKKLDISLASDTPIGLSRSISLAIEGLTRVYRQLRPDIVVILGDRFEALAAAISAAISRIPLAHLNGGEATFGAMDEAIRHSITKMSHLHFTSTEEYRRRVIQLGEDPERVFNVGAVGLDNIKRFRLLSKEALEKEAAFKFRDRNLLITFHPVTLEYNTAKKQFANLLSVLNGLKETSLIFTKANADTGGRIVNRLIDEYAAGNAHKSVVFSSMGQLKYLSTMQFVDGVVGNSSSGIIEAPSFKIGTINIGDRQAGRIKAESIIDCKPHRRDIGAAIKRLYSKEFSETLKSVVNPHGDGKSAKRIIEVLKDCRLKGVLKKVFFRPQI